MAKCIKCGTELVYIEEKQIDFCPKCGSMYSAVKPLKDTAYEMSIESEEDNTIVVDNVKHTPYDKMSVGPTIGAIICAIGYIICLICQVTGKTFEGIIIAAIFGAIFSIGFTICLVFATIYSCIDKYHLKNVAPLQNEISELKKEIEKLKKELK